MDKIGDGLKKVMLAGIGAIAVTGEKSQEIIDSLVKKGEITVEQGKALNKELRHNVKTKADEAKENIKAKAAEAQANAKATAKANADRKDVADMLKDMSAEQIEKLKELLETIKADDTVQKASDAAEEVVGKAEEVAAEAAADVAEKTEEAADKIKEAIDDSDKEEQ